MNKLEREEWREALVTTLDFNARYYNRYAFLLVPIAFTFLSIETMAKTVFFPEMYKQWAKWLT